jgi:hypothetical protein
MKSTKGFVHHPMFMAIIAFIIGALVMYLFAKKIIPGLNIC